MRRIFYLITELDAGGAEKALCQLATRLDPRKFDPAAGCLTGRGVIGDWLKKAGVPVTHVGMRSWGDIASWARLRRTLKEFRPHVLHTFLFHANLAGRLMAPGLGIERVISSVRVEEPRHWHLCGEALTQGLVDAVTCVSASARRFTHNRARVPMRKLVVIPNGIDADQYDLEGMPVPHEWDIPENVPVVACIGRLSPQKNPLLMLRAAASVVRRVRNVLFVFAGEGPLERTCRSEARKMGLQGNVRWLGWVEDVRPLLARMDLLALSSKWEGMPNVLLEAMAYGKPVVTSNVGGCGELVVQGETGFLFEQGDATTLGERVEELLLDDELCRELGSRGRRRVMERFSLERMVRANEELYE